MEWALVPHGFESNHSITVRGDKLYRKFFRIIPGVSLFADHVDAEEDFKVLPIGGELAIFEDGCYVLSKLDVITRRDSKLDKWPSVDFCLRDPSNDSKRALHVTVSVNVEQSRLVDDVRCVLEKYSCIYCDGANMDGTSGFVEGWVSEQPGSSQSLLGTWSGHDGSKITRTKADMEKWLFLPQGIHIGVTPTLDGGACVHAGWLVNSATCISVRRTFNAQGRVTVSKRVVETLQ